MTGKTNKKRYWPIISLSILIISSLTVYLSQDKYGEGQSEELRRLWNHCLADNQEKEGPKFGETIRTLKENSRDYYNQIIHIDEKHKAPWQVTIPEDTDISLLPLEGLTEAELLYLAYKNQHVGACLKMGVKKYSNFVFYSIRMQKKWFSKARDLGRPGADFLLEVVTEQENQLPNFMPRFRNSPDASYIEQLPGYPQFRELILQGDFELYETLMALEPDADYLGLQHGLAISLKAKAEQGDTIAQRQLGQLGLSKRNLTEDIRSELNRPRGAIIQMLSKWISIDTKVNKSPSWDEALKSVEWLEKAADAGDLQAMYLWLKNGIGLYRKYDRKTWDKLFTYWNQLMQAGYQQTMKDVYFANHPLLGSQENVVSSISWHIIASKYSQEEMKRISKQIGANFEKRSNSHDIFQSPEELLEQTKQNKTLSNRSSAANSFDDRLFYSLARLSRFFINATPDAADLFRNMADQGEPAAQYMVADAMLKKSTIDQNILEARDLLEKAWPAIQKYNTDYTIAGKPTPQNSRFVYSVSTAKMVFDRLIGLYTSPNSPAYDSNKAFALANQYLGYQDLVLMTQLSSFLNTERLRVKNAHYYMGLMHERGMGTKQNIDKALDYYRQGADIQEIKSIHALARCHQLGLGIPQNLTKATDLYKTVIFHDDYELEPDIVDDAKQQLRNLRQNSKSTP